MTKHGISFLASVILLAGIISQASAAVLDACHFALGTDTTNIAKGVSISAVAQGGDEVFDSLLDAPKHPAAQNTVFDTGYPSDGWFDSNVDGNPLDPGCVSAAFAGHVFSYRPGYDLGEEPNAQWVRVDFTPGATNIAVTLTGRYSEGFGLVLFDSDGRLFFDNVRPNWSGLEFPWIDDGSVSLVSDIDMTLYREDDAIGEPFLASVGYHIASDVSTLFFGADDEDGWGFLHTISYDLLAVTEPGVIHLLVAGLLMVPVARRRKLCRVKHTAANQA